MHGVSNCLPVREDLRQVPGAEDVPDIFLLKVRRTTFPVLPQRCSRQEPGGSVVVLIVTDGRDGIGDLQRGILILFTLYIM